MIAIFVSAPHRSRRRLLDDGRKANRSVPLKGITNTELPAFTNFARFSSRRARAGAIHILEPQIKLRWMSTTRLPETALAGPNQTTNFGTCSLSQRVLCDANTWIKF